MPVRTLMFTLTGKHVLNLSNNNEDGSPESPHFSLTLPGYSWRRRRHEGDKGGVDGINFNWPLTIYVWVIFYLHASWHPPDEFASTVADRQRIVNKVCHPRTPEAWWLGLGFKDKAYHIDTQLLYQHGHVLVEGDMVLKTKSTTFVTHQRPPCSLLSVFIL
jgi:hypothetical protein